LTRIKDKESNAWDSSTLLEARRSQSVSRTLIVVAAVLLVFALASGAVLVSYSAEIERARAVAAIGGRTAETGMGPIEYAEKGSGRPLLSIHGAGGGYDQGLANVADLVGDGYRVIAPSRFGYLGTPIPADSSPAAQAEAHVALLAELGIEKAVVVGISAGARSAVELALRHPEKISALILIVPGTYAPTSPVAIEGSRGSKFAFWLVNAGADFAWWATGKLAPSVLIRFIGVPPEIVTAAPKDERERVIRIVRNIQPLSRRFPGINIDSTPDLQPPPLEAIDIPTLIISARDDLFNTLPAAEFAAAKIPNAELVVFETGGHLLVGHQREVRAVIDRFLADADPPPAECARAFPF
jgi:2-hydroxy-6-oxonona-2,4-dienedioate hydrolase